VEKKTFIKSGGGETAGGDSTRMRENPEEISGGEGAAGGRRSAERNKLVEEGRAKKITKQLLFTARRGEKERTKQIHARKARRRKKEK